MPASRKFGAGGILLAACLLLAGIATVRASCTPNSQFASRLRLESLPATLSGSFANPSSAACGHWWAWTAPVSTHVVMQVQFGWGDRLRVFIGPDEHALTLVTDTPFGWKRYATFYAVAGTEYHFHASAFRNDHAPFRISLRADSLPILLEQPVTQTIFPGEAAFFAVAAAVSSAATNTIQWQFNGVDLPGETLPVLSFTNATTQYVGEYRAIVTAQLLDGGTLTKTTAVARLNLSAVALAPTLSIRPDPLDPSSLVLDVTGEEGRSYVVISGRDLAGNDRSAGAYRPGAFPTRWSLWPSKWAKSYFISAQVYHSPNPVCIMYLEQLRFARERRDADHKRPLDTPIALDELGSYVRVDTFVCSEGGNYTDSGGYLPYCVMAGHVDRNWGHPIQ